MRLRNNESRTGTGAERMRLVILLIGILGLASNASAQNSFVAPLENIQSFSLEVGILDKDDLECGLTWDSIRQSFLYPASSAKFSIKEKQPVVIKIGLLSIFMENRRVCVSHVQVEVY